MSYSNEVRMKSESGSEPAFPNLEKPTSMPGVVEQITTGGLTKREYFAVMAMQARIASGDLNCTPEVLYSSAVADADALLAELEKSK
jgi:hypothetical protein